MAKSTAHVDAIGSFENFSAPWESEAGSDAEIDKSKLKRLIYNVRVDVAKSKDALADAKADLETVTSERDAAKGQAADGSRAEAQRKIDKLQKQVDDLTTERDGLVKDKETAEARKEVLGEFEAKYPKAAKYVKGETVEELEKSLKEVAEDWSIDLDTLEAAGDGDDGDDDGDTDLDRAARTAPRTRSLLNPGDRANGKGGQAEYDFDKTADTILSGGRVFG
mgnify:CR=1 FL=1